MDDELVKSSYVCKTLGCSRGTVSNMVADGRLQPVYTPIHGWRFKKRDVDALLHAKEGEADG